MTAIVTQAIAAILAAADYETLSTTFGVIGIILLLLVLVIKEFVRSRPTLRQRALRVFDIAAWPLLLMFGTVILMRLLNLLGI